ncbi:MAG: hypothetical protein AAF721_11495, partial [Myxococcota bacterium]
VPTMGCDTKEEAADTAEKKEEIPNVQVGLPASPNFDDARAPEKWEDGSLSIFGLRSNIDENIKAGDAGTEVELKGFVQEIYVPPECPPDDAFCDPGKQPHFWITDKADTKGKKRAMMVVNYRFQVPEWDAKRWKDAPDVIFEKGKQYTFKGKFKQFSDTGFAFDKGLLEFVAYKPYDPETGQVLQTWVHPPGAPWHPIEIARQEEANAALVEKSKGAAAGG